MPCATCGEIAGSGSGLGSQDGVFNRLDLVHHFYNVSGRDDYGDHAVSSRELRRCPACRQLYDCGISEDHGSMYYTTYYDATPISEEAGAKLLAGTPKGNDVGLVSEQPSRELEAFLDAASKLGKDGVIGIPVKKNFRGAWVIQLCSIAEGKADAKMPLDLTQPGIGVPQIWTLAAQRKLAAGILDGRLRLEADGRLTVWSYERRELDIDAGIILPADGEAVEISRVEAVGAYVTRDWSEHGVELHLKGGGTARVIREPDATAEADPSYDIASLQMDTAWAYRLAKALADRLKVPYRDFDVGTTPAAKL